MSECASLPGEPKLSPVTKKGLWLRGQEARLWLWASPPVGVSLRRGSVLCGLARVHTVDRTWHGAHAFCPVESVREGEPTLCPGETVLGWCTHGWGDLHLFRFWGEPWSPIRQALQGLGRDSVERNVRRVLVLVGSAFFPSEVLCMENQNIWSAFFL